MAEYDADFQSKVSEVTHKPAIVSWGHLSSSWKGPCKEEERTPASNQHLLARWGSNLPWKETLRPRQASFRWCGPDPPTSGLQPPNRLRTHTAQLNFSWIPDPQKPCEAAFTFKLLSLGVIYYTALSNIYNYTPLANQRRRQWHPTPALLSGKSHGWRNLVDCSPWGR